MHADTPEPLNLDEYEEHARRLLPRPAFDFFAGGAADELTLAENRRAFRDLELHYRVLAGVGGRDLSVTVLGRRLAWPVLVAPMGFQSMAHPDGEPGTARAAGDSGTVLVASTMSNTPIEVTASAASGPVWFQLYIYKDRGLTRELVARAEACGCEALQFTADLPVMGRREGDIRNRFGLPAGLTVANFERAGLGTLGPSADGGSGAIAYTREQFDGNLSWRDVEWLRGITRLPVLVKGIVRGDDAARALEHGAAGVVVSNHGGRQLDTAPAPIRVLPEVAEAVAGRGVVLLDGGVRRGTDVVKAIALGADAVQLGRPILWGLALGGEAGVRRVLAMLRAEVDAAMALCGATSWRDLPPGLVRKR